MLDPVKILQDARTEATGAISIMDESGDWQFVFDLMCNAIGHQIGAQSFVEITHQQPVVAMLDAAEAEHEAYLAASDIDDGGVEDMECDDRYTDRDDERDTLASLGMREADFR